MEIFRQRRRIVLGALGFALVSLIWGTQFLVIKKSLASTPAFLAVALRFAILALVAHGVVISSGAHAPSASRTPRIVFGIAQALSFGALYWAQKKIASSLAGILTSTTPIFVALFAHFFLKNERLRLPSTLAIVLGFVGVSLIVIGSHPLEQTSELAAVVAILAGEIAGAVNKVLGKHLITHVPPPLLLRDMGAVVSFLAGAAWLLGESGSPIAWTPSSVLSVLYLGLVPSFAASGLYMLMLRRFRVTLLSYIQFTSALVAAMAGILLNGESLSAMSAGGAIAILMGLALFAIAAPKTE